MISFDTIHWANLKHNDGVLYRHVNSHPFSKKRLYVGVRNPTQ